MYVQRLTAWSLKPDHLYSFYGSHDQLEQVTKLPGAMFLLLNGADNCRIVLYLSYTCKAFVTVPGM